ncbi:hypothetical protein TrRE_jg2648 [Triparma retinervis]|uniref:EGF-like domain-containing protein n=1 Tax=Triparma retinervis TaxID=2557542 RepID=A0A9W7CIZ8_9STRA|nr:hypothetical protein TrRE_jg2648 [Triparma retinervis]
MLLLFTFLTLIFADGVEGDGSLEICRNLHLDQQLTTITSSGTLELNYPIGDTHTGDADVSALLDPNDTSRFGPSVKFKVTISSESQNVRISFVHYLDDEGNGVLLDLSSQEAYDAAVEDEGGGRFAIAIPDSSYVNPDTTTWTDMRAISVSVIGPGGYTCNCEQCCEQAVVEGCSIGGTFKVDELSPPNGIGGGNTTVQVLGEGFFRNAGNITCKFGDKTTAGTFLSSTAISCISPPYDMGGEDYLNVPFSLSLDSFAYTEPTSSHFKYIDCPGGCSDTCGAEECRCPPGFYGSTCQHPCDCLNSDGCASLTGDCRCREGWTGDKCDVECPGGEGTCDGNGACYLGQEGDGECACFGGFWGDECGGVCPREGGKVCGGRGDCEKEDGLCDCRQGYFGAQCELECPGGGSNPCSGNGVCCTGVGSSKEFSPCGGTPVGRCACDAGWRGSDCSERYCFQGCWGHGVCGDGGVCACEEGWGGEFCQVESGTDASKAYISFDASTYFTSESLGMVTVNVTRYGNIDEDVSVMFKTVGLTATPGEDYIESNQRLLWIAESGEPKEIKIIIMRNEGVSEGEESFELILTSPVPKGKCALGKTHTAIVKIAAKEENVGKDKEIAKITIHVLRDDSIDLEFMKKKFATSTVAATGLEATQVVFPSDAVSIVGEDVLSLEFHILPGPSPLSSSTMSVRDDAEDDLDRTALNVMQTKGILGMTCSYVLKGRTFNRAWGYASCGGPYGAIPCTVESKMRIASVSKVLTSVAILRLSEAGALDLDPQSCKSQDDLLRHVLATVLLDNEPGTKFAYSNLGYLLLGRIIEACDESGKARTYEQFVKDEVWARCGLSGADIPHVENSDTGTDVKSDVEVDATDCCGLSMLWTRNAVDTPPGEEKKKASSTLGYYTATLGERGWMLTNSETSCHIVNRMDANGGWVARASDLVKFSVALADGRLLGKEMLQQMGTPPGKGVEGNYCMGVINNGLAWFHDGALSGTGSIWVHNAHHQGYQAHCGSEPLHFTFLINTGFGPNAIDPCGWECVPHVAAILAEGE